MIEKPSQRIARDALAMRRREKEKLARIVSSYSSVLIEAIEEELDREAERRHAWETKVAEALSRLGVELGG